MVFSQPFYANISVPDRETGRLVVERIARHDQTCILHEVSEDLHYKLQYRRTILDLLRGTSTESDTVDRLVEKFIRLAEHLELSRAIALPFRDDHNTLATKWTDMFKSTGFYNHTLLGSTDSLQSDCIGSSLLHPLIVALLAYQMGGALNAANTGYVHRWKASGEMVSETAGFHVEGDTKNIFDDHRVTLVWEERQGSSTAASGRHHTFTEHKAIPRLLTPLSMAEQNNIASPVVIIYDSRNTALWYECQDAEVVRNSIGLDFHVNTIQDAELSMLSDGSQSEPIADELTLNQLITGFPTRNYTYHFNRLLFDANSRDMILSTLEALGVPEPDSSPNPTLYNPTLSQNQLRQRFQDWNAENLAHTPDSLRGLPNNYPVHRVYETPVSFVESLGFRIFQDIHSPIGMNLVPQTVIDEQREEARKRIRDQSQESINQKLATYMQPLTIYGYDSRCLLPTAQLQAFAEKLQTMYLDLTARGYTAGSSMLLTLSSLSSALGKALNGPKETEVMPEPRVTEEDLQIYRTRSLYLFWCADCLMRYLVKLREGEFMINRLTEEEWIHLRHETVHVAELLLRNWVAWTLFMDTLPAGEFTVLTVVEA